MNGKPGQYKISNPNSLVKDKYSTEYNSEYFEIYSPPIRTRYSEVFWKMMDPVPLPAELIKRFENKTMAIIGYEIDQVMRTSAGDVPVPINHAYNHHYMTYLMSKNTKLKKVKSDQEAVHRGYNHGAAEYWTVVPADNKFPSRVPVSQLFSEGNGGEMRLSYHGYPKGYAQLIRSPDRVAINPMQIDTMNRNHTGPDFKAGPLPRSALSPPGARYSGLLECPCTTRLHKEWHTAYGTQEGGTCKKPVQNESECFRAARSVTPAVHVINQTVASKTLPLHCSVQPYANGTLAVFWNTAGAAQCGTSRGPVHVIGSMKSIVGLTVELNQSGPSGVATITITGPSDVWFGVGFGADSMCLHPDGDECPEGGPYAIIVAGDGTDGVTERKLADHGPGSLLRSSLTVVSSLTQSGVRTVVLTRPLDGLTKDHYTFDPTKPHIAVINAKGRSLSFGQHLGHASATLMFLSSRAPSCICNNGVQGSIDGVPFPLGVCAPEPTGDLLTQHNPTCQVQTYSGGLRCCRHGHFLLDADQTVPEGFLEYHHKYRFYFEEYVPDPKPSHLDLVRLYWQTEAHAGEYDIVPCDAGTPPQDCIQEITSRWRVKDMMRSSDYDQAATAGIKIIYAGPHCHAATCVSMELYNADTGKLLCRMEPILGQGTSAYGDEEGYVALPPCLWGDTSEGLMIPELLHLDTELLSIKRNNNSVGHYGDMASWQMRGVVVPLGIEEEDMHPKRPLMKLAQSNDYGFYV